MILVQVCLLEMAELGLQVLEVLCDAFVLLGQPHVGLCILLLMLGIACLQTTGQVFLLSQSLQGSLGSVHIARTLWLLGLVN